MQGASLSSSCAFFPFYIPSFFDLHPVLPLFSPLLFSRCAPVVFMGSEKYPSENGFDAFLKKHGGSDNASTDCERTVFQFDVQRKSFREALDRWGRIRRFFFSQQSLSGLTIKRWFRFRSTQHTWLRKGETQNNHLRHVKTVTTYKLCWTLWIQDTFGLCCTDFS